MNLTVDMLHSEFLNLSPANIRRMRSQRVLTRYLINTTWYREMLINNRSLKKIGKKA